MFQSLFLNRENTFVIFVSVIRAIQRNRSHSFDNILSRNKNSSNGKENLSFPHVALLGDTDGKLHSSHLSHTSEESAEELVMISIQFKF